MYSIYFLNQLTPLSSKGNGAFLCGVCIALLGWVFSVYSGLPHQHQNMAPGEFPHGDYKGIKKKKPYVVRNDIKGKLALG